MTSPETKSYYVAAMKVEAPDITEPLTSGPYTLLPRNPNPRMRPVLQDMQTLREKHGLDMAYELFLFFYSWCPTEFHIEASSLEEAKRKATTLKIMLFLRGGPVFTMPYICTHSRRDYAGIHARDSGVFPDGFPDALKTGITSATSRVEAWSFDLYLGSISRPEPFKADHLHYAADYAPLWEDLISQNKHLKVAQDALVAAPTIPNIGQSLLHIWTGIEALFPQVNSEVTFKLSIYLAQLYMGSAHSRRGYLDMAKKAYGKRSKVAHGVGSEVTLADWEQAWRLLLQACNDVMVREKLPSEKELEEELFPERGPEAGLEAVTR